MSPTKRGSAILMKFSDALQPNSPLMAPILQESYSGESTTKEKRPGLFSVIKAL